MIDGSVIEGIVFDMDGLLFDSERIVQRSWEDAGNELGIRHMGSHIYHTLGMNVVGKNEYFLRVIGPDFPKEEFAARTRVRFREIVEEEGLPIKPGVLELLEYGKSRGYKMSVATSSRSGYAIHNLEEAGIYRYFDGAIFGDMVHLAKPDPEIYLKACEAIKIRPKCSIALEDAPAGIRSAYAAGMIPVMIPDLVEPDEEIKALVHRQFKTLHEVIGLLEQMDIGK